MPFSRARPSGFGIPKTRLLSTELEIIDSNQSQAIDGYGGGTWAPTSIISVQGEGLTCPQIEALSLASLFSEYRTNGTYSQNDYIEIDATANSNLNGFSVVDDEIFFPAVGRYFISYSAEIPAGPAGQIFLAFKINTLTRFTYKDYYSGSNSKTISCAFMYYIDDVSDGLQLQTQGASDLTLNSGSNSSLSIFGLR